MEIRVTGDERDVANSAWVSTLSEVRAQKKSKEEVQRVVKFLVDEHHTSPFESVTITFEYNDSIPASMLSYSQSLYARVSPEKLTIDLLNFAKTTWANDLWNEEPWRLFESARPALSELIRRFGAIPDTSEGDVGPLLGDHRMQVELVHLHEEGSLEHSRATWRVRCPLSIAVQILRHRTGSYNMVSGRYRTIAHKLAPLAEDVVNISEKAGVNLLEVHEQIAETVIPEYRRIMKELKEARDSGKISNNDYKRARECARFILPEGRMTELYITYYLSDFYGNFKLLRDSVHAQTEHIWVAQEMARTLEAVKA